jgi:xanthine dehydrogenase YagS FAD-binding subunit
MLPNFAYVRPESKQEALDHLGSEGAHLHAGGTDLLGCLRDEVFTADKVVSISGLEELAGIVRTNDGGLRIGALTTISDIAGSDEVARSFPGLAQAAQDVASPQLRNQGTLGGNLCQRPRCWYFRGEFHCAKKGGDTCYAVEGENRYHAIFGGDPCYIVHPSDTAPMLVALGAAVKIAGPGGERTVALEDFFVLPEDELHKENDLQPGEMVTEIFVPPPASGLVSSYRKVRERGSWDFALASVALALRMSGQRVEEARVVLGGVAPKPWRSPAAEAVLVGKQLDATTARAAADAAVADAQPMEQNGYKVLLVKGIVEESLLAI